jgi:hypothetical protein
MPHGGGRGRGMTRYQVECLIGGALVGALWFWLGCRAGLELCR